MIWYHRYDHPSQQCNPYSTADFLRLIGFSLQTQRLPITELPNHTQAESVMTRREYCWPEMQMQSIFDSWVFKQLTDSHCEQRYTKQICSNYTCYSAVKDLTLMVTLEMDLNRMNVSKPFFTNFNFECTKQCILI